MALSTYPNGFDNRRVQAADLVDGTGQLSRRDGGHGAVLFLFDLCLHNGTHGEIGDLPDVGAVADGNHFGLIDIGLHDPGNVFSVRPGSTPKTTRM